MDIYQLPCTHLKGLADIHVAGLHKMGALLVVPGNHTNQAFAVEEDGKLKPLGTMVTHVSAAEEEVWRATQSMLDLNGVREGVQVQIQENKLWVNVDGICRLRISHISPDVEVVVEDSRRTVR